MRWMVTLALGCLLLAPPVSAQRNDGQHLRYRWTDATGHLHLADEIPPEAARRGYDLINQYGRVVRHVDGEKTPEQLAAEKARADAARRAAEQKRADQQLLLSYPTEGDLVAAQDEHLTMLRRRIEATEINMKSQLDGLANVLDQAAAYKQRGDKVPAYIEQEIGKQRKVIREQRDWLAKSRTELDQATTSAAAQLDRYRALRGGPPAAAGSTH